MNLIDSHCHIDGEQFDEDRDEVMRRAKEAGVVAMLNVGTGDPHSDDFSKAVAVAERYENVFAAVGVHPHDAKLYDDVAEQHLIDLAKSEKVIAWGEIGLDYYYDHSPRDVQKEVFRRQIAVAKELGLPIIVHSRDSDEDTLTILADEFRNKSSLHCVGEGRPSKGGTPNGGSGATAGPVNAGHENITARTAFADEGVRPPSGVMHCFGGKPEMAKELLDLGFLISFAGNVTFKKAENLREAAAVVPLDRLLVETDCPFLTPVPFRSKRNEPAYVVHTAKFLAEFYGVELDTLAAQTTLNFLDLFQVKLAANFSGESA
ncbi:MAG: TatD family hydrolase [Acidobacteriota bacterium]